MMPETPSPKRLPPVFSACAQGELAEAQRVIGKAIAARIGYTVFGIGVVIFYMTLVFGLPFVAKFFWASALAMTVSFAFGTAAVLWVARRTLRFYTAADEPEADFLIDDDLRREALNIPFRLAIIDLILWFSIGSGLAIVMISGSDEQHGRLAVHAFSSAFYAGQLVAIMEYYAMERFLGRSLYPYLMRGRKVSEIEGVAAVPVFARLTLLVLTISVFPMLYLFMLSQIGDADGDILLFLIGLTVVNGLWQGNYLGRSVSLPIGRMAGIFERFVRYGNEPDPSERIYRADPLGRFSEMFDELVGTMAERDFIRNTFGRYMSQQVVDEILNGRVELGGTLQNATVLFADIRGFTTLSEKMHPTEIVDLLNEYLENMVQAITTHDGVPDKFIGDGVMAVWGIPVESEHHQEKAVRAAFEMMRKLDEMNQRRSASGREPLRIGIGIHSGELVAGNIGSKKKMEFTVIGDTVNTCSRIENANKELGTELAVSEDVFLSLPASLQTQFSPAPPLQLRGKGVPLTLYACNRQAAVEAP